MLDRSRPDEVLMSGLDADVTMDVNPLAAETPGTGFQDLAPIHVVCTATLQAVAAAVHRAELEFHRYRPNFVVMMKDAAPFCENDWVGRELQMGSVRLKVTRPTPRCAIPTLAHGAGDQFRLGDPRSDQPDESHAGGGSRPVALYWRLCACGEAGRRGCRGCGRGRLDVTFQ